MLHEGLDRFGSAILRAGGRSAFVHVAFVVRAPPWPDFQRFGDRPLLLESHGGASHVPDRWSGEYRAGVQLSSLADVGPEPGSSLRVGRMWWRRARWQPTDKEWLQLRAAFEEVIGKP